MVNEKSALIEVNSLSLQSSDPLHPENVLLPSYVTATMCENAQQILSYMKNEFPQNEIGLSLHAGAILQLTHPELSSLPITSYDIPDVVTPTSTFLKFLKSPQLINRIVYALNSTLGWNTSHAYNMNEQLVSKLSLMNFVNNPFVRMSLDKDTSLDMLAAFPENWTVACEFDPEDMELPEYLSQIKAMHELNPNIGISLDLAHLVEYYILNEKQSNQKAYISAMNIFEKLMKDTIPILSVDINNIGENGVTHYGQTHHGIFNKGLLSIKEITSMYMAYSRKKKRVNIETSPRDLKLFWNDDKRAYLFEQLSPLKP